jgi:hypothetical protein
MKVQHIIPIIVLLLLVSLSSTTAASYTSEVSRISRDMTEYIDRASSIISKFSEDRASLSKTIQTLQDCEEGTKVSLEQVLSLEPPSKFNTTHSGLVTAQATLVVGFQFILEGLEEDNPEKIPPALKMMEIYTAKMGQLTEQVEGLRALESASQEVVKQGKRDYEAEIKAYAKKKWPDDYEMQAYEFKEQMNALNQIQNLPSTADYNESILSKAMAKWGEDYQMVIYEYNKQLEAYKKMR